ncbi:agamous-like MADS-box protein AGL62 [Dendrobium catenatum]|uniref:Agamous-like MADS-box protein AGL62 n=1 Tax=Dendrobium catenatum TaxID=906689 RepID=A0A2I0VIB9_9ASPA|nr:agamous-like MADS-box protein AGL62 [Dendrobium catenatum]PKU63158.1 Agamous-like MADS-box protein AGL62 [Dendrobium catenatum]
MDSAEINKKKGKGRRKIEIKRIEEEQKRQVCFSKRRQGLFKKASELSTLCGVEVAVVVFSPAGKPYFFGQPSVDHVLNHFLNVVPNPSNQDQPTGESFWWDIDLHSMGVDELKQYEEILAKQQSVVTEAAQQCYLQAPEGAAMEQIEALPYAYPEVGEDDYFLCWQQDYDCLDIVPI